MRPFFRLPAVALLVPVTLALAAPAGDVCATHHDDLRDCLKQNFADAYAKVEPSCESQPKGPERFACRQKAYAKLGITITPAPEEASAATSSSTTTAAATTTAAPDFAGFAATFQSALVAGNSSVVLASITFPLNVVVHPLATTDGKTFTVGTSTTRTYDKATWSKVATCGFPENGESFPDTPQWRCDLFYAYSGMTGLNAGTTVVDATKHTIQTSGYDPTRAVKGLSMTFAEVSGAWMLSGVQETYYAP